MGRQQLVLRELQLGQSIPSANPTAILLSLGVSDYGTNVASATFKPNMLSIISQIRSVAGGGGAATCPIILVADYDSGVGTLEPWANYVNALYAMAAADPTLTVLDISQRMGVATADTLGLIQTGHLHLTDKGDRLVGGAAARFILDNTAPTPPLATGTLLGTNGGYNLGSSPTVTNAANAYADVDATNVAATFVCPPSGKVKVTLNAIIGASAGSMNVRDSHGNITNSDIYLTGSTALFRWQGETIISTDGNAAALVPGTVYTFKLGFKSTSGTATMKYGGGNGPITMNVYAA